MREFDCEHALLYTQQCVYWLTNKSTKVYVNYTILNAVENIFIYRVWDYSFQKPLALTHIVGKSTRHVNCHLEGEVILCNMPTNYTELLDLQFGLSREITEQEIDASN